MPRRLYYKISEPRIINLITFFGYLSIAGGGILALVWPPMSIENEIGNYSMTVLAFLAATGGLIGLISVLPGWWHIERVAILFMLASLLIYYGILSFLIWTAPGNRFLQASVVFFGIMALLSRYMRVSSMEYDPTSTKAQQIREKIDPQM